jgi:hypothetical protein
MDERVKDLPRQDGAIGQRLRQRLGALQAEFSRGQDQLIQAETRARELREALLRIAGAIQVLQEELGADAEPD